MKKKILIGLALGLIALGLSAPWWLPQLLSFAVTNGDAIQSITSLVQLVIWGGAAVIAIAGLVRIRKPASTAEMPPPPASTTNNVNATGERSVAIREATNSKIYTGDIVNATGPGAVAAGGHIIDSNIFTGPVDYHEASPQVVQSLHQLPSPLQDFTDRDEEMAELITNFKSGTRIYVLYGMGGLGKRALAAKLAGELSQHYQNAQFHMDLDGNSQSPLSVAQIMTNIITSYYPRATLPMKPQSTELDMERLSGMCRSVLYDKQVLFLMSNAADEKQVESLLQPNCAMVITSHRKLVLPKVCAMKLNPLQPKDARDLLQKITNRVDDQQADAIARLCGYLPAALRWVASAISMRDDIEVADFIRKLGDENKKLELAQASLSLSYGLLKTETQRLWLALAVFPGTFDAQAAAAVWDMQPDQAQDALSDLYTFSLVEHNKATSRYRLHDLVRIFADERLSEDERNASQRRHALHYLAVLREAGELYFHSGKDFKQGLDRFDMEWANIQASQEWAKKHVSEDQVAAAICDNHTLAGAELLALRRLPQERIAWHETVIAAARRARRRIIEGANLCFIGVAYRDSGDFDKAIDYCQQARQIAREENDLCEESYALSYTGIAYYYKGDYRNAIDHCQQALAITLKEKDKRSEIEQLRYLGHARRGLGQYEQAVEDYKQSLKAALQIEDLDGANSALGGLGRIHCDMGKHEQAIKDYLLEALKLAREIEDRQGEGFNLSHLGLAHRDMGQYEEAKGYYVPALRIAREIGQPNIEAYCLGGLGKTLMGLGHYQPALDNLSAAFDTACKTKMKRAQQHWKTVMAQVDLHQNRLPEASETIEAALSYNSVWNNYRSFALHGVILARLGQAQPAREAFEKASEHAAQLLEGTPLYFDARYILGLAACGLALTAEEKAPLLKQAEAAYRDAYSNCRSPGVIEEALRLLEELLRVDGAGELSSAHALLKGFMRA